MANVTITRIEQTDTSVMIDWTTDTLALNNTNVYVATNLQNLQAGVYVATGNDNGNLPDTDFQATIPIAAPMLQSGTPYVCMASCDGTNSQPSNFTTLPDGVYLRNPHAQPRKVAIGGVSTLMVEVRKKGKPEANIPVTFTCPAGAGQLGNPVQGTVMVVNTDANGQAATPFMAGNTKGRFQVTVTAAPYAANTTHVLVVVKK
jgi:hypothetical protein